VPSTTGPQAGNGHWQQSFGPAVGVLVAVAETVAVAVTVGVNVGVGDLVSVAVCDGVAVVVDVGVVVGVGVCVTHSPEPVQAASKTGAQPSAQVPPITGPQAGNGH
jgi:hypothetical protein